MIVRSKIFSRFVKEIERLKPSLSKQHNKMLKIRPEMLKIKKNWQKKSSLGKTPGKIFRGFLKSRESREFSGSRECPGIIFENFPFPKSLKRETLNATKFQLPCPHVQF